jgi:hypothetical protein
MAAPLRRFTKLCQALDGKADHLAQQVRIGALLQQRAQAHHAIGHCRCLVALHSATPNPVEEPEDRRCG